MPRRARRDYRVLMARKQPNRETLPASHAVLPTEERIRERAHQIWIRNGHRDGFDLEDWMEAERELMREGGAEVTSIAAA